MSLNYNSIAALIEAANTEGKKISQIVLAQQAEQMEDSEENIYLRMKESYEIMRSCIEPGCDPDLKSTSGLTGGDAYKMRSASLSGNSLTGNIVSGALYRALAISELNASMGRIVAAPTAGSCGILPAAILTLQDERGYEEKDCIMSLFTASAVGMVIATNASIAGAEGGCQAECGAAAAMAAAAITELAGGSPAMISHAVGITLKNILGLVCDPVAGLVEIPCIKRNASGVAGAFAAAEMALAGIPSYIPADEVILAMKKVGNALPSTLKETSEGGLAVTPTGIRLREKVFGS